MLNESNLRSSGPHLDPKMYLLLRKGCPCSNKGSQQQVLNIFHHGVGVRKRFIWTTFEEYLIFLIQQKPLYRDDSSHTNYYLTFPDFVVAHWRKYSRPQVTLELTCICISHLNTCRLYSKCAEEVLHIYTHSRGGSNKDCLVKLTERLRRRRCYLPYDGVHCLTVPRLQAFPNNIPTLYNGLPRL